jgi:hypothetical protein
LREESTVETMVDSRLETGSPARRTRDEDEAPAAAGQGVWPLWQTAALATVLLGSAAWCGGGGGGGGGAGGVDAWLAGSDGGRVSATAGAAHGLQHGVQQLGDVLVAGGIGAAAITAQHGHGRRRAVEGQPMWTAEWCQQLRTRTRTMAAVVTRTTSQTSRALVGFRIFEKVYILT